MKRIDEKTLIPISLMVTLLGGMAWLTTIYLRTEANATAMDSLQRDTRGYTNMVQSIDVRLARIEERLGIQRK